MFAMIKSTAIDDGALAFKRAITLMRKHPRILEPASKVVIVTMLVLASIYFFSMFFAKNVDASTYSFVMLAVAATLIGATLVIELFATIILAANVRFGHPLNATSARSQVKHRLWAALKDEPIGTLCMIAGALLVTSAGYAFYLFVDVVLEDPLANQQSIALIIFCGSVMVIACTFSALFTVLTARYVFVHKMGLTASLGKTRAAIQEHKIAFITVLALSVVTGCIQAMLAFVVVQDHVQWHSFTNGMFGMIASISMFLIMWVVHIVPYIAVTERRQI